MYKVYADDILIHDAKSPSKEVHLVSPVLDIGDSVAGSFEFTMLPFNVGYNDIQRFTTTIIIYRDSTIIWTGRVITQSEDFWHCKKFTCEGALAYLNDSQQPLHYYSNMNSDGFFSTLIANHNARVPNNRKFQVGTITMHDFLDHFEHKTDYTSTYDCISELFVNNIGGHIRVRYSGSNPTPIIDYLEDYPNTSSQEINFGNNLLEFTKNWDLSELCTVIIPLGAQQEEENDHGDKERLTIASVNNGSIYLQNSTTVARYGQVERVVTFDDAESASVLKTLGENYLQVLQFDDMVLNVSAVDLHLLTNSVVSFNLLDEVRCISAPHGLDRMFPITKINIPLDQPDGVTYTMGTNVSNSMSSQNVSSGKSFSAQLNRGLVDLLADAKANAAKIINSATTGYVNIITENETSQALIISNTPDIANATKLWRFNLNGLGYSEDGGATYKLAMTMDGTIVADFIKTGIIEDGVGYNKWNLTTGEFTMAYNTKVANTVGDTVTVLDIVQLAQDGVTDAATAQATAVNATRKQAGGTNILNGTNKNLKSTSAGTNSEWSAGTWDGNYGPYAEKSIIDVSGAPNPALVKGFKIRAHYASKNTGFTQRNIKVVSGQVYVASCYARANTNTNAVATIGFRATGTYDFSVNNGNATTSWKRFSLVFRVPDNTNAIDVVFGNGGASGTEIYICGMKLERGNTATDWSESEWDTYGISTTASAGYTDATAGELKTYTKKYTDTISDNDRAFTKSQRQALDDSFTQYKVLKRLTNNFASKGIYLTQNQLYINATYIRTGTLDAGIIKAGILTDIAGNNKWNLATGYLYTKNMEAINMRASGRFECGDYYKMVNDGGEITGYRNYNTYVGSISPNSSIWSIPEQRVKYGLSLRASENLDIRTPEMSVRNRNDDGTSIICYTGQVSIPVVSQIRELGQGRLQWTTTTHNIHIINGLIVAIA